MRTTLLIVGLLALSLNVSASDGTTATGPDNKIVAPLILKIVSTEQSPGQNERFTHKIFLQSDIVESIDALKRHLLTLPRGTRIEFDPSCLGIVTRPLTMGDDLETFQAFCLKHDIRLSYATHKDRVYYLPK